MYNAIYRGYSSIYNSIVGVDSLGSDSCNNKHPVTSKPFRSHFLNVSGFVEISLHNGSRQVGARWNVKLFYPDTSWGPTSYMQDYIPEKIAL